MTRRHAAPEDFALVGMGDDPTPGDPELIRGVSQRYGDVGDAAQKALNVLKSDGTISGGRGSAIDKLKEKIGQDLPDKLNKTATSYLDAAQAYRDYIPRLQEAQETFDRAVDQAQAAAPAANAQAPVPTAATPTEDQKVAARRAQDAISAGQDQLSAAKGLAEQAKSMRQSAQGACADVLDRAASEAIPERNIFQKIVDFFSDFPFVQILLGLLIAVVTVFFPIAGLLLGGALFLATQIPAIASGNFKLGDFLTGLVGLIPGGSLLKAGGGLIKGVGVLQTVAPGAAKVVKGPITGIGASATATTTIGPLGIVVKVGQEFGKGAGGEAATQVLNGDNLNLGAIAGAGVLGAAGAGALIGTKGGKGGGGLTIPSKGSNRPGSGDGTRSAPGGSGPPFTRSGPATSTSPPATRAPAPAPTATLAPPVRPGVLPPSLGLPRNTAGGVNLAAQEALGGHAIARHVGQSQANLDLRLTGVPAVRPAPGVPGVRAVRPIPGSSTFTDITAAEKATTDNIAANQAAVSAFASSTTGPGRLVVTTPINPANGIIRFGPNNPANPTPGTIASGTVSQVKTVLQRDASAPGGFRIITSFPEPRSCT